MPHPMLLRRRHPRLPLVAGALIVAASCLSVQPGAGVAEGTTHGLVPALVHPDSSAPTELRWAGSTNSGSTANLSVEFSANLTMPSGPLPEGRTTDALIGLTSDGNASLGLTVLGVRTSLSIPVLGDLGRYPVPGVNYTYLGIVLQVYVRLDATITARCSEWPAVPEGGCPGNLSWARSGDRVLELTPPSGPSATGALTLGLSNISLAVAANLTAEGAVPFLGNVTVPLGSPVRLVALGSSPASVNSTLAVTNGSRIESIRTSPGTIHPGDAYRVVVTATTAAPPLRFNFSRLPPGCLPTNRSSLNCTASAVGGYEFNVSVTDQDGVAVAGTGWANVTASSASTAAWWSSDGATGSLGLAAGLIAAAGLATVGAVQWRRRRTRRPGSTP